MILHDSKLMDPSDTHNHQYYLFTNQTPNILRIGNTRMEECLN
jgi:hypothetical protein